MEIANNVKEFKETTNDDMMKNNYKEQALGVSDSSKVGMVKSDNHVKEFEENTNDSNTEIHVCASGVVKEKIVHNIYNF